MCVVAWLSHFTDKTKMEWESNPSSSLSMLNVVDCPDWLEQPWFWHDLLSAASRLIAFPFICAKFEMIAVVHVLVGQGLQHVYHGNFEHTDTESRTTGDEDNVVWTNSLITKICWTDPQEYNCNNCCSCFGLWPPSEVLLWRWYSRTKENSIVPQIPLFDVMCLCVCCSSWLVSQRMNKM